MTERPAYKDDPLGTGLDPASVLPVRVDAWAAADPDRLFLSEVGGRTVTYGQFLDEMLRWCAYLADLGITPGDRIASFLPASIESQALWLAASCVGAVEVGVNPELRGDMLRHVLTDSAPVRCFARPDNAHVPQQSGVDTDVIVVERDGQHVARFIATPPNSWPSPADVSCVIYTSGTTGPAKGAVIRWAQMSAMNGRVPSDWFSERDCVYAPLPMFHVTGRSPTVTMAHVGGRVVFREKLSVGEFWSDIRAHGCTSTTAASAALLLGIPERADDAENPLRIAMFGALGPTAVAFARRFSVRIVANYGSTEIGFPFTNRDVSEETQHLAGWLRPGYEARVVGPDGTAMSPGEAGELHVRPPHPLLMTSGYLNRPDATAEAMVDGWYRTGDAVILNADNSLQFIDRMNDTLRRFGENISGSAVVTIVNAEACVLECAVLAVPSAVAGHEVLLVIRPLDAAGFDAPALFERLRVVLPKHCLPAFIAVRSDHFPKTPNGKIRKVELGNEISRVAAGDVWQSPAAVAAR